MRLFCSPSHSPRAPDSAWSWLVCFSGSLSFCLVSGVLQCYAVVMPVLMEYFQENRETTAWVGSVAVALVYLLMPLSTTVMTRLNIRYTAILGTLMCITSLVVTSFTTNIIQVFLSYSILYGLGFSLLFASCLFATTKYFVKKQAVAIGIVTGGAYVGVLSLGPILQLLVDAYGFRMMYRIMAGSFVLVLLAVLTFDPNVQESATTEQTDIEIQREERSWRTALEIFKKPMYVVAAIVVTLQAMAAFVSFVHLVSYCLEVGISAQKASRLFTVIGISTLASGILAGRIMDYKRVNPFHVNQAGALSMGLATLLLQLSSSYLNFMFFSVFLGFGIGVFNTTIVVLLLRTVEPKQGLYSFSIGEMIAAIGDLTGAPLIGFIADSTGSYKPAFYTAGAILMLSFFLPFLQYCFEPWRTLEEEGQRTEVVTTQTRLNDTVAHVADEGAIALDTRDDTKKTSYVNEAIEKDEPVTREKELKITAASDDGESIDKSTETADEPYCYDNEIIQPETVIPEDSYETKF